MSDKKSANRYIKESEIERAKAWEIAQANFQQQKSHLDVPVYPQGYLDPEDKSADGKIDRPMWLEGHCYNSLPLSTNWLPSNPTSHELVNLYYQLEEHAHKKCALSLDWGEPPAPPAGEPPATPAPAGEPPAGEPPAPPAPAPAPAPAGEPPAPAPAAPAPAGEPPAPAPPAPANEDENKEKYPLLTLPSRRVKQNKTPCTSYREPLESEDKGNEENERSVEKKGQEQESEKDYRSVGKFGRGHKKPHQLRKEYNRQNKDNEAQPGDNEAQPKDNEDPAKDIKDKPQPKKFQKRDAYHIIRVRDRRVEKEKPYVEFLRQNSSGYIFAFRALADPAADGNNAYWACCDDAYEELAQHLPFYTFKKTNYGSGYSKLSSVAFGSGTLEIILDEIYSCYLRPRTHFNRRMQVYLQIIMVIFGEGPRFEAVRDEACNKIDNHTHGSRSKLGVQLEKLIHLWSSICRTAYHLLLMLLEEDLAKLLLKDLKDRKDRFDPHEPHHSFADLFLQLDSHWLIAQNRCAAVELMPIQKLIQLKKEHPPNHHKYGRITYNQIVGDYIPFLLYLDDICSTIIMRRDLKYKKQIFPPLTSSSDDTEFNAKADMDFWEMFESSKSNDRNSTNYLKILKSSRPVLDRYGFRFYNLELDEEVKSAGLMFGSILSSKQSGNDPAKAERAAAKAVRVAYPSLFDRPKVSEVMRFLSSKKPLPEGSHKNICWKEASSPG